MKRQHYIILAALALAWTTRGDPASAQSPEDARLNRLKAAYALNFLKFVEWPGAGTQALRVAVIGDAAVGTAVRITMEGRMVQGRPVSVRTFATVAEWKETDDTSQALLVTSSIQPQWAELLGALAGKPVLTIADAPGFCAAGGLLDMFVAENHIRFDANPSAAALAGLRLRSELLKLATIVKTEGPPP